jgi:hypothetical protein
MLEVVEGLLLFLDFFRAAIASGLVTVHLRTFSAPLPKRVVLNAFARRVRLCDLSHALEPGDMYTPVFVYTTASVTRTSATPRADPRIYPSSCSQSAARWSKRFLNFSVAGVFTSFAALAMVLTYDVTYRLCGTLDRSCKLDMEQHCKWIVHGSDGLGGKGCTRAPKLHRSARSWARFPNHWLHGIVRNLEGCASAVPP